MLAYIFINPVGCVQAIEATGSSSEQERHQLKHKVGLLCHQCSAVASHVTCTSSSIGHLGCVASGDQAADEPSHVALHDVDDGQQPLHLDLWVLGISNVQPHSSALEREQWSASAFIPSLPLRSKPLLTEFKRFQDSPDDNFLLHKLSYTLVTLVYLGLGAWKCSAMGLIPSSQADWLEFVAIHEVGHQYCLGIVYSLIRLLVASRNQPWQHGHVARFAPNSKVQWNPHTMTVAFTS